MLPCGVEPSPSWWKLQAGCTKAADAVGPQLVSDDLRGRRAVLLEQLAHLLAGRRLVPPALDQDIQHLALVILRPPQEHLLASDAHRHLVQVPSRAWLRPVPPKTPGDRRPELQHPAPDGLVGDVEPALGQQVLDVAVAEREAEVQPHRVPDDLGRELMAGVGDWWHRPSLRRLPASGCSPVTMPARRPNPCEGTVEGTQRRSRRAAPSASRVRFSDRRRAGFSDGLAAEMLIAT